MAAATNHRDWRFRDLWQVPTLLLGIAAAVTVYQLRPSLRSQGPSPDERQLALAQRLIEPPGTDAARALVLAQELLVRDCLPNGCRGEVRFVLGSACFFLAKRARPEDAKTLWNKARQNLESAVGLRVSESETPKLIYRLGVAWYRTGADPRKVIECLSHAVDVAADDPVEGYSLLTQSYLHLTQPDVTAALAANQKLIDLPSVDESILTPARLLRGELLVRSGQPDEARKVLGRIPATAPAPVLARSRQLRADCAYDLRLWAEAAQLWQEMVKDSTLAAAERGGILYRLGVCYKKLDQRDRARAAWKEVPGRDAELAQAAALGLADLCLGGRSPGSALEYFEAAVKQLAHPADYHNRWLGENEARDAFERGVQAFLQSADYEHALELAKLFAKLAPARSEQLVGQAAEAWASDSAARAGQVTGADADLLQKTAGQHFREAAEAYESAALSESDRAGKAKWLKCSADCFLQAQQQPRAIAALKQLLTIETGPEQLGQVWFRVAQAYEALHDQGAARSAYLKCIEYPGAPAFRARYELAHLQIAAGNLDDAEDMLRQNLDLMRGAPDDQVYENTLRALAGLEMKRGDFRMAALRLQEMLDRYPAAPGNLDVHWQLADCYRRLAAFEDEKLRKGLFLTEEAQLHYREQRKLWMQKAAAHFQKLAEDLAVRRAAGPLSGDDEKMLRQVSFAFADTNFELGNYTGAIRLYEEIVGRYPDRVEALQALKQITRCHWVLRDQKKAAETVQRVRATLKSLSDQALAASGDGQSRKDWQDWLDWAEKQ
jgi:tetratricopeptide (TPR) repeat protein